ncbi:MAG: hypothetical protein ACHQ03_12050, partial [Candidatus Bathyarchaeia archaeon]
MVAKVHSRLGLAVMIALLVSSSFPAIVSSAEGVQLGFVTSQGHEQSFVMMEIAAANDPLHVFQITGGQLNLNNVSGGLRNYITVFINTSETFDFNASNVIGNFTFMQN